MQQSAQMPAEQNIRPLCCNRVSGLPDSRPWRIAGWSGRHHPVAPATLLWMTCLCGAWPVPTCSWPWDWLSMLSLRGCALLHHLSSCSSSLVSSKPEQRVANVATWFVAGPVSMSGDLYSWGSGPITAPGSCAVLAAQCASRHRNLVKQILGAPPSDPRVVALATRDSWGAREGHLPSQLQEAVVQEDVMSMLTVWFTEQVSQFTGIAPQLSTTART